MELSFIIFIAIVLISIIVGAQLIIKFVDSTNENYLSSLVAISSGILLGLTFHEFLPRSFDGNNEKASAIIFLGILSFIICDKYLTPRLKFFNSEPSCKKSGCGTHDPKKLLTLQTACTSISCLVVCAFFDGIELAAGFSMDSKVGWTMALALYLHIAPTGALAASLSIAGNLGNKNAFKSAFIVAIALVLGLLLSVTLNASGQFTELLLPFATGVMIYNLLVHLIPATLKFRWGLLLLIISAAITMASLHSH